MSTAVMEQVTQPIQSISRPALCQQATISGFFLTKRPHIHIYMLFSFAALQALQFLHVALPAVMRRATLFLSATIRPSHVLEECPGWCPRLKITSTGGLQHFQPGVLSKRALHACQGMGSVQSTLRDHQGDVQGSDATARCRFLAIAWFVAVE